MDYPIIKTDHLDYAFYQGEKVLRDVNLRVPSGSIYGFLGPNGAGKTTTLRLLLGLLRSKQAEIRLFGQNLSSNRIGILQRTGSLIEQPSLYLHLTGRENLEIFRLTYGANRGRIDDVLQITRLTDAADKRTKAYSLGMKQRLAIAIALLPDPELMIMDEPTNGLDPNGIIEIRELVRTLNKNEGKTILISSHLLSEVEKVVTHVGIIHHGSLLFQGTLSELQHLQSLGSFIEVEVDNPQKAFEILTGQFKVSMHNEQMLHVHHTDLEKIPIISSMLVHNQVQVYKLGLVRNDLEELFLQIISA